MVSGKSKHKEVHGSKKYFFSDLKHTKDNVCCTKACEEKLSTMHHNNLIFIGKKSFAINDLLKLRVQHDPLTSKVSDILISNEINLRKRNNVICGIRLFK